MTDYPMLRLVERYGGWLAVLLALVPPAMGMWALALGWHWGWLAAGIGAGGVVFVVVRSYVELVRVMIDMLLPK